MIDSIVRAMLAESLVRHIDQRRVQTCRLRQAPGLPLHHPGDYMGHLVDIDHHPRHIAGSEQLPCRILIYDAIILHQIVSRKIGSVQQLHRMKQKIVAADAYGIRRNAGLVAGDGHGAVCTVGICPQSCTRILRIRNHGCLCQRLIHTMLKLYESVLGDSGIHREETADLRHIPLAAPPSGHRLVRLTASQTVRRHKQDQEHYKGYPSAYSQYYFFHQTTSFPSGQGQLFASLTSFPASTGLVEVVITNS